MPIVIAVAQQKGGAGKRTLAANLAVALAAQGLQEGRQEGRRVALIDADPQRSLAHWRRLREANAGARAGPVFVEVAGLVAFGLAA